MVRIRYKQIGDSWISTKPMWSRSLESNVNVSFTIHKYTILSLDNKPLVMTEFKQPTSLNQIKLEIKNHLKSLGVVFQDEVRVRIDGNNKEYTKEIKNA